jgi:hypothetical protein
MENNERIANMQYRAINQDNSPNAKVEGLWRDTLLQALDDAMWFFEINSMEMMVVDSNGDPVILKIRRENM